MNVRLRRPIIAIAILAASVGSASAQATFDLIDEYPATSLSGEADTFFAEAVNRRTEGLVKINLVLGARSGLRSRDQLTAVSDGRFAIANSFGGALGEESPVFELSSLPFLTSSVSRARTLYEAARPLYENLFTDRQQKLLYVTPWPPSGIWSAIAISSVDALNSLRIRTYDTISTEVFAKLAREASQVSFADLNAKLEAGEVNAVLSSGDGGAGRQLWRYLRHFCDIQYAMPLSFAAISLQAWNRLDNGARTAIEQAARETTDRQWAALDTRVAVNFAWMRANGVIIEERPSPDLMMALREAALPSIASWSAKVGPEGRRVLNEFQGRPLH
jgi:TRAP-type C4-dicarboxylate transport system substrate-binding protein